LFSAGTYKNEALYRKWVEGLESGNIKGITTYKPKYITKMLSVAAEAHIRLEAWLALRKRDYRHTPSTDEQVPQAEGASGRNSRG
jgi:hypothetical protein